MRNRGFATEYTEAGVQWQKSLGGEYGIYHRRHRSGLRPTQKFTEGAWRNGLRPNTKAYESPSGHERCGVVFNHGIRGKHGKVFCVRLRRFWCSFVFSPAGKPKDFRVLQCPSKTVSGCSVVEKRLLVRQKGDL